MFCGKQFAVQLYSIAVWRSVTASCVDCCWLFVKCKDTVFFELDVKK
jgi:hypothetical protein